MTSKLSPQEILALPMIPNDADAKTVHEYIIRMAEQLWIEDEGFSGKRPFGNSGWQHEIYASLVKGGAFPGTWDEEEWDYSASAYSSYEIDEENDEVQWKDLESLVRSLFTFLRSADPLSIQLPPVPEDWYVVNIDEYLIASQRTIDGPFTEEFAKTYAKECNDDDGSDNFRAVHIPR